MNFQTATSNYISSLSSVRRRGVLSANSQRLYAAYARKASAHFLDTDLSLVKNGRVKAFVESLRAEGLSPNTIVGTVGVLKAIVSSVKTEDGEPVYSQKFDAEFLALPIIRSTEQTCATSADVERAVASGVLIVPFLAATGLRISEALALSIDDASDSYDPANGTIHIRKTLKTQSAKRSVLLPDNFKLWLNGRIPSSGKLLRQTYQQVHAALNAADVPKPHAYRRFRVTVLRRHRMQEDVLRSQLGHSKTSITDQYSYAADDADFLRSEIERCGLGFSLESVNNPTEKSQ
jgi:integrase